MTRERLIWIACCLLVAGAAWTFAPAGTTAQDQAGDTLQAILEANVASGEGFTVEFRQVVPRVGKSVDLGGDGGQFGLEVARVGSDVLCVVLPGTTNTQITCVPYSNISAVFYAE
ncbi:MAG: hypothetical protein AAF125_07885 [Chloroflexota bacterium]